VVGWSAGVGGAGDPEHATAPRVVAPAASVVAPPAVPSGAPALSPGPDEVDTVEIAPPALSPGAPAYRAPAHPAPAEEAPGRMWRTPLTDPPRARSRRVRFPIGRPAGTGRSESSGRARGLALLGAAAVLMGSATLTVANQPAPSDTGPVEVVPTGETPTQWAARAQRVLDSTTAQLDQIADTEVAWERATAAQRAAARSAPIETLRERRQLLQQRQATLRAQLETYRALVQAQQRLPAVEHRLAEIDAALGGLPPVGRRTPEQARAIAALLTERAAQTAQRDALLGQVRQLEQAVSAAARTPLPSDDRHTDQVRELVLEALAQTDGSTTRQDRSQERPPGYLDERGMPGDRLVGAARPPGSDGVLVTLAAAPAGGVAAPDHTAPVALPWPAPRRLLDDLGPALEPLAGAVQSEIADVVVRPLLDGWSDDRDDRADRADRDDADNRRGHARVSRRWLHHAASTALRDRDRDLGDHDHADGHSRHHRAHHGGWAELAGGLRGHHEDD